MSIVAIYNLSMFERDAPMVERQSAPFNNGKAPIVFELSDQSGIKSYQVVDTSTGEIIEQKLLVEPQKQLKVNVELPFASLAKKQSVTLNVIAKDASKWNFLDGNSVEKQFTVSIDRKRPQVSIISNSYAIEKGGSAAVVFSAKDKNLKELYIDIGTSKRFKAQPFYKKGYYIALIAWPVTLHEFRAYVVAEDKAGNSARSYIPLRLQNHVYRRSTISISDKFLHTTIADLAQMYEDSMQSDDPLQQFKLINETVRAKNEQRIHRITSNVPNVEVDHVNFKPFYPLKNAKKVANFGDHRYYTYNGEALSESYHLGLDLASIKHGKVHASNAFNVVFAQENGIYGNNLILYHGLGLYTLYGHCSNIIVNEGEHGGAGTLVANTGKSGYALGDHLHFGVLVQGVEVRPEEWMDKQWIRLNIKNVVKDAKALIKRDSVSL